GRKFVVVIRRKGAPHDRAGCGEVDRKLIRDGRMLDIGDTLRREQRSEDVAVLAGLARGERGERPDRQAEVEADAVEVAGADACASQDEQAMLGQELPDFVHEREDRVPAAIHDGASADLYDLQPGKQPDRAPSGDGMRECAVEEGLARERRGDVLDLVDGVGHGDGFSQLAVMMVPTCSPASARVRLPGTRPFTICTSRTYRAEASRSSTGNSRIESCSPFAFISATEIFGIKVAPFEVFGFAV